MKVKVLKALKDNYCYECCNETASIGVTTWLDVEAADYIKLRDAVNWANMKRDSKWFYFIVEQVDDTAEVFTTAQAFHDEQKRIKDERDKIVAAAKAKRAKTTRERKLKQLAKLKQELEG